MNFWGDCVATAAYLINTTPSPLLQNNTPYELLYGKRPDYSALRVFGCLAYSSTLISSRHKFTPRAIPCVFVGYPTSYKGYKLYNLSTRTFLVSSDVTFRESSFPFHSTSPIHTANEFIVPPDLVLPTPQLDLPHHTPTPTVGPSAESISDPP